MWVSQLAKILTLFHGTWKTLNVILKCCAKYWSILKYLFSSQRISLKKLSFNCFYKAYLVHSISLASLHEHLIHPADDLILKLLEVCLVGGGGPLIWEGGVEGYSGTLPSPTRIEFTLISLWLVYSPYNLLYFNPSIKKNGS